MPTTLVHGLLPAACLWFSQSALPKLSLAEKLKVFVAVCIISNFPDLDLVLSVIDPPNFLRYHRWYGHNIFALTCFFFLSRRLLGVAAPPLTSRQRSWISALLLASHVVFDAMGGGGGSEHAYRHGSPLFWPFSNWELLLPRVFPVYHVEGELKSVMGHIFAVDYWTRAILTEFMISVLLLSIWVAGFHAVRLGLGFYKAVSGKKDFPENVSPFPQSSLRYSHSRPSRRRLGDSPPRKGKGSSQEF